MLTILFSLQALLMAVLITGISSVWLWKNVKKPVGIFVLSLKFVFGYIYGIFTFNLGLKDVTFSAYLISLLLPAGILLLIETSFQNGAFTKSKRNKKTAEKETKEFMHVVGVLCLVAFVMLEFYPIFLTQTKLETAQIVVSKEKMEPTNEKHLPVVADRYALYKAKRELSNVKNVSYYEIGSPTKQVVNNILYFVYPIEYRGLFKWAKGVPTPGFIMVNAENPNADAKLIKENMTYVPSAYFNDYAKRIVRKNYPNVIIMNESFEVNENLKGYYVYPYGSYKTFRNIRDVKGVIVLDPITGKTKIYSIENAPKFIDQIIPTDVASERMTWYGKYRQGGLWNSLFAQTGVVEPTQWGDEDGVVGLFDNNLHMGWFSDFTNPNGNSDSMVGFALMNSRTGEIKYYNSVTGISGIDAKGVASKGQLNAEDLKGSVRGLFNIYGQPTWLVSLEDKGSVYRYTAFVSVKDVQVYAYANDKGEALANYSSAIADGSNITDQNATSDANLTTLKGIVVAVYKKELKDRTTIQFMLKNSDKIFNVSTKESRRVVFLKEGDVVDIKYLDTKQESMSVQEITNESLNSLLKRE
jgi:hypothetical protein